MSGPVNAFLYDSLIDNDQYKVDVACYNDVDGDPTLECRMWVQLKPCKGNSNFLRFGWGINKIGDSRFDYAQFEVDLETSSAVISNSNAKIDDKDFVWNEGFDSPKLDQSHNRNNHDTNWKVKDPWDSHIQKDQIGEYYGTFNFMFKRKLSVKK